MTYFRPRSFPEPAVGAPAPDRAVVCVQERGESKQTLEMSYCGGCSEVRKEDNIFVKVLDILRPSERVQMLLFHDSGVG